MSETTLRGPLRFLGVCHLLGGALGIAGILLPNPNARTWPDYWIVANTMLAGLSVASGLAILGQRPAASRLAAAVESLQLVAFHTGSYGFQFYSGVQAIVLLTPSTVRLSANLQSSFGIGPAMLVREPFIAFDLLSIVFLGLLWHAARTSGSSAHAASVADGAAADGAV